MLEILPQAPPAVAAAYRTPGLALSDLLNELHTAGVLGVGTVPGKNASSTFHYSARLHWLQPYGRRAAAAAPGGAPPRRLAPLPTSAAKQAPRPTAAGAAGAVEVTIRLPQALGKDRVSRANALGILKNRLGRTFQGGRLATLLCMHAGLALPHPGEFQPHPSAPALAAESPATAQLLQLAVACLLSEGLEKTDTLSFRQNPVSLKAARKSFEQQLRSKSWAVQACYRDQFGGSLAELLRAPPLAPLVWMHGVAAPAQDGWQQAGGGEQGQVQLLLSAPPPSPTPAGWTHPAHSVQLASAPAAAHDEFEGWSFDAEQVPTAASAPAAAALPAQAAAASMAAVAAASHPAAAPGPVSVQLIATESAAAAAVDALLAAAEGQIGVACTTQAPPSVALFAPGAGGGGSVCYVLDLAAMSPPVRDAAVSHLARLMESPQPVKVRFRGGAIAPVVLGGGVEVVLVVGSCKPPARDGCRESTRGTPQRCAQLASPSSPTCPPQVLHDCRSAAQALFNLPGRSIELHGVWDTQARAGPGYQALSGTRAEAPCTGRVWGPRRPAATGDAGFLP